MKTLQELFGEILQNEGLAKALCEAEEKGAVGDFLKENGCEASAQDAAAFLEGLQAQFGELSDEELRDVSGGKITFSRILKEVEKKLRDPIHLPRNMFELSGFQQPASAAKKLLGEEFKKQL